MNVDNFVDEIEEVSNVDIVVILFIVFFEDFFVVNIDNAVLHIKLLVIHLILLADFTQSVLKHKEKLLTVQIFLVFLIIIAPNRSIDLIELLLCQIYSHEILLGNDRRRVADLILLDFFKWILGLLFWELATINIL